MRNHARPMASQKFPFEVPFGEVEADLDTFVDAVFSCLESEFLRIPKGEGFIEYPVFENGYEALKLASGGFAQLSPDAVLQAALETPMVLVVLRAMLGFSPPEWAYAAQQHTGVALSQGFVRDLDRRIRMAPSTPLNPTPARRQRISALVEAACHLLGEGSPKLGPETLHRLDKADTRLGLMSIRSTASIGVPYAMLLYERFLGRPLASHRDSVSEMIGDRLESAIEEILSSARVSFRKTKRAEKLAGFDQTPDFVIPDEFNPAVVIEAKVTEDDGTARDKVTRVQHLAALSVAGQHAGTPRFEVVACIAGRGFGVRRQDMRKLILATRGKVFTPMNLAALVAHSGLAAYATASKNSS